MVDPMTYYYPPTWGTGVNYPTLEQHTHGNKIQLDKVGESSLGEFLYDGKEVELNPDVEWNSTTW